MVLVKTDGVVQVQEDSARMEILNLFCDDCKPHFYYRYDQSLLHDLHLSIEWSQGLETADTN